jgi:cytoskeletal protein CcmA (bactofilin family)
MFRKGSPQAEGPDPVTVAPSGPESVEEEKPAKAPARRAVGMPSRPLGNSGFPIDIGRRGDPAGGSGRAAPSSSAVRDKHLIVGKEVRLKGEVTCCEKLVVEGEVEIELTGCRSLHIGPSGVYRGRAEVSEADVAGRFEGEIETTDRLSVRASGRVSGKIRYGQITIDAGGQVAGEIVGLEAAAPAPGLAAPAANSAEPAPQSEGANVVADQP